MIKSFLKGFLGLVGVRLIDPIEVYYDLPSNTLYPIVSKSGCSSIKLRLIHDYAPNFESKFPEIHKVDPATLSHDKLQRKFFYNPGAYRKFAAGKHMVLIIREPKERFFSCYVDVNKGKNIMYEHPSGLHKIFKIGPNIELAQFLQIVARIPDRLSDRHFRGQNYFLTGGVESQVLSMRLAEMGDYLRESAASLEPKLNVNPERLSKEQLDFLESSTTFQNRFKADIALFKRLKKGI